MAKFRKEGGKRLPAISTASLPDIVFMLLFFFMTATTMKERTVNLEQKMPSATELTKLEKKSLVKFIYVGKPKKEFQKKYGTESMVQLNDQFKTANDVEQFISNERASMKEQDQGSMIVSLKIDKDTKMGIVTDVKQALRNAYALKISYTAVDEPKNKY